MKNNFNIEIQELAKSTQINDKLMIFSIYQQLYNSTVTNLNRFDNNAAIFYGEYLTSNMKLCVAAHNSEDEPTDYNKFIKSYIELIKSHGLSCIHIVSEVINHIKGNTEAIAKGMTYVNAVDSCDVPFEEKANMIITINEHIEGVLDNFATLYGNRRSIDIRRQVTQELIEEIPSIISEGFSLSALKAKTQEIIFAKLGDSSFDFNSYKNNDFFTTLDEKEKRVYTYMQTYALAGYSFNNQDAKQEPDEAVATKLGMSLKEYQSKNASLQLKIISKWLEEGSKITASYDSVAEEKQAKRKRYQLIVENPTGKK